MNQRTRLSIFVVQALIISLMAALFGRLFYLQIAAGGKYNPPEPQIAQTGEQAGPPKPANLAKQEPNKPRNLSDLVFAGINSTFDVLDSIMGPILESINPTNQNQPSSQTPTTSDVQISPDMARNEKMWDTYEKMYLTV